VKLEGEQLLLRVYLRTTDKYGWSSAAQKLVERARKKHLAGATVLRGIYGCDDEGEILEQGAWSLCEYVPVIVEFVDSADRIVPFLKQVREIAPQRMATLERAHVLVYRHNADHPDLPKSPSMRLDVPAPVPPLSTLPALQEQGTMKLSEDGQLLRIFVGESDDWEGHPLYKAIVLKAKELGLAGATVLRGPMGYGANSRMHTTHLLELSNDLPLVIEIVDSAENIQRLLPFLDESVAEGLITIEAVRILQYRHNEKKVRP
jgi:uncharacterized protein